MRRTAARGIRHRFLRRHDLRQSAAAAMVRARYREAATSPRRPQPAQAHRPLPGSCSTVSGAKTEPQPEASTLATPSPRPAQPLGFAISSFDSSRLCGGLVRHGEKRLYRRAYCDRASGRRERATSWQALQRKKGSDRRAGAPHRTTLAGSATENARASSVGAGRRARAASHGLFLPIPPLPRQRPLGAPYIVLHN